MVEYEQKQKVWNVFCMFVAVDVSKYFGHCQLQDVLSTAMVIWWLCHWYSVSDICVFCFDAVQWRQILFVQNISF